MSITQKQWDAHSSFRTDLKKLLDDPVMQVALGIVLDIGTFPIPYPGGEVNLIHFAALTGARKEGCIEALKNLEMLAKTPAERPAVRQPWATPQPTAEAKPPTS